MPGYVIDTRNIVLSIREKNLSPHGAYSSETNRVQYMVCLIVVHAKKIKQVKRIGKMLECTTVL